MKNIVLVANSVFCWPFAQIVLPNNDPFISKLPHQEDLVQKDPGGLHSIHLSG